MKRKKFLLTSLLAIPVASFAKFKNLIRPDKPFKVDAGKDRFDKSITLFEGDTFYTKVATKDTDGDIFVFESSRIKEGGPSYHYHFNQDEWWYVLQGEFLFKVGDTMYKAKAGDSVFGPRMVPHTFAKLGEGEGKLLMFFQPAGKMEEAFKKISEGVLKNKSGEEIAAFWEAHGAKGVGPALSHFKEY
jgi:mannose-6-phosphate isomerase-like protein (cupin superfamily)